jgi:hypothetical protein
MSHMKIGKIIVVPAQWLNAGAVKVREIWEQVLLNGFFVFFFYLLSKCAC